ncbi:MAG: hypothetical protein K8M05_36420 [Deltaproteobacteria bacterium]|nr:hypothetical protein [Kofleriaceae bacterium]
MNDIVLCEGVAHATTIIKRAAPAQPVPAAPSKGKTTSPATTPMIARS